MTDFEDCVCEQEGFDGWEYSIYEFPEDSEYYGSYLSPNISKECPECGAGLSTEIRFDKLSQETLKQIWKEMKKDENKLEGNN